MRYPIAVLSLVLCLLAAATGATAAPNDPLRPQQYGMDIIHADQAHAVTTGQGSVVAVIDTGVLPTHEDLQGRLLPENDVIAGDKDRSDVNGTGHGTHVSGIVAANANNGIGVEGAAPGAKVLPIRVLDDTGSGTSEDVAKGIDYAVAQKVDVINLSLGGDAVSAVIGGDDVFTAAIDRAVKAGIVVVAAAGNDSLPICEQPSVQGKILCVGAIDRRGMRSFFSSSGNITAPGGSGAGGSEDITSTFNDGKYTEMAGTSQATPHVSGVAALLASLGLHGQQVVDRIIATAAPAAAGNIDSTGVVDAQAAVAGLSTQGGHGGSTSGGAGGPTVRTAGVSYRRTQRIRAVLAHGVRVRCRTTKAGRCKVVVKARRRTIATGSRRATAAGKVTVAARVTPAGRRLLRKTGTRQRAVFAASVPGASKRIRRVVTLVR